MQFSIKFLIFIILFFFNIILYFIILKILSYYLLSSIFFNSIVSCFFLFFINIFLQLFIKLFNFYEIFIASLSIVLIFFTFSIFGPIFIDRSISYQILFDINKVQTLEIDNYYEEILKDGGKNIYNKRFKELGYLKLIKVDDSNYELTNFGKLFTDGLILINSISKNDTK